MRLTRFLTISLLAGLGTAPVSSQAPRSLVPPPLPNPFATQPLSGSRIPPMDFHVQPGSLPRLSSRTIRQLNPFVFRPNDLYAPDPPHPESRPGAPWSQMALNMAHNDELCYAIRDYRLSHVTPGSDAMQLSGTSTCLPSSQVHLRAATVGRP